MADSEAEAVAALVARPTYQEIGEGAHFAAALPPGWHLELHDFDHLEAAPRRARGTIEVYDAESFVAAVHARHLDDALVTVYADEERMDLVAVLNDDVHLDAGWRDYRVAISLRLTPEWRHWASKDREFLSQSAFAEHVEGGIKELRSPDPAAMLELAQTFSATTNATMKSGVRLSSGEVQFRYEEEVEAKAGAINVPDRLTLAIKPFIGSSAYEVQARFRYRLTRGDLTMGYQLDRPHEVLRAAFTDVRNAIDEALSVNALILAGPAPKETPRA
jgi:uncharacterized protein YfdQ (DUF2303 family)